MGRTTNERFSKKAQRSFSEAEGDTTTYLDDRSESESLIDNNNAGHTSRGSIVDEAADQERNGNGKASTRKRGSAARRNTLASGRNGRKSHCMRNLRGMMCNKRIVSQRELYEKQVNKIDILSESYREAAQSSSVPSKASQRGTNSNSQNVNNHNNHNNKRSNSSAPSAGN